MRKIASILLIFLALMSCTQEITRNNPSLQGLKDGVLWRAKDSYAVLSSSTGALTLTGLTEYETLTLMTNSPNPQTYILGTSTAQQATYQYARDGVFLDYATGIDIGDGQIVISEYDAVNNTITGTFRFNAENLEDNPDEAEIVNYQQGVFYKIPITPIE
jgi:hypothetical protein